MQTEHEPRFLIGIDLGPTNTAVAWVDTRSAEQRVELFAVPQLVAPDELEPRRQLPSFVYLAGAHDLGPAETALPWSDTSSEEQRLVSLRGVRHAVSGHRLEPRRSVGPAGRRAGGIRRLRGRVRGPGGAGAQPAPA